MGLTRNSQKPDPNFFVSNVTVTTAYSLRIFIKFHLLDAQVQYLSDF